MRGGVKLSAHKARATSLPIARATVPAQLFISLSSNAQLLVKHGDQITIGQPLAQDNDLAILASASGTIKAVRTNKQCVVIDNDGRETLHSSIQPIDLSALSPIALRERIELAGMAGLGGAAFPTGTKIRAANERTVSLLIVNAAECEPFIRCDEVLVREQAADVLLGTQALMHACGATQAVIAIENDKSQAITALDNALSQLANPSIRIHLVDRFYPAGGERQLIRLVTGNEVPSGKIPPDMGVLCQNVGTAVAVAKLVRDGMPLIERVVTVTGNGVNQSKNLLARFGTPIASLIRDCGDYVGRVDRLILGGPMMGVALDSDEHTVNATTNCVIAASGDDLSPRGIEMPCIRCGECAHVCPAYLLPQQLLRFSKQNDRAALLELGLNDCIECGCCDYVCPSQIPLAATFVAAKQTQT
jgi:Na+-translocating ferredoxin:NAD+ oxidoreductase subunit C